MQVHFTTEGGLAYFPGLRKPTTIDTTTLPAQDAQQLQQLFDAARFFTLPAQVGTTSRGAADMRHYTITVEDGARRHTVRVSEPVTDPALQNLIEALQAQTGP